MGTKKKERKSAKEQAADDGAGKLAEHLEVQRTRVICGPEMNYHVNTVTSAMAYMSCGFDNSWKHDVWAENFSIEVTQTKDAFLEFEMVNIDPALVNALRRILIAEVPTVCIEHVFVVDNTSVMQEEVLSHRLGLVPLKIDPDQLSWKEDKATESNTVVFKLHVECTRASDGQLVNDKVLSKHLQWLPRGSEYPAETATAFVAEQEQSLAARPVHDDILLCKLVPGQCIELEAHAVKGTGGEHAKWSPVATAWHRMYPEVAFLKEVPEDVADDLVEEVPEVFRLSKAGKLRAKNVRQHEDKLERIRYLSGLERYRDYIEVRKRKEHFIFTIESTGVVSPATLFARALDILKAKCQKLNDKL